MERTSPFSNLFCGVSDAEGHTMNSAESCRIRVLSLAVVAGSAGHSFGRIDRVDPIEERIS